MSDILFLNQKTREYVAERAATRKNCSKVFAHSPKAVVACRRPVKKTSLSKLVSRINSSR